MEFSNLLNKCSGVVPTRLSRIGRFLSPLSSSATAVGIEGVGCCSYCARFFVKIAETKTRKFQVRRSWNKGRLLNFGN
ncbi:hypothetical protein MRB53_002212 [Persea americana]|uniref:Uncharacterized protein n=1 Tax=Persea americana TaxID=3435 RepID=A0ACC2MU31_PERAE|nr:hypothetical protein MRB53_002212 [Persea americana]